ncbi:hypothetical protein LTR08_000648 [Meristemomyces frigidus]|nr:hypothetical protein LTR08_000648 [Meristemomyces frigidus]
MKFLLATTAITATLYGSVSAFALPEQANAALAPRQTDTIPSPQQQQVMASFSSAFGWTLAGTASSDNELDATCANITNTGHHKWAAAGLMPAYIVDPICNSSHASPNTTVALPWTILYNTDVFVTQLTNAFAANNSNTSLTYMCDNIRFIRLDGVHMMDARALNSTCAAAGLQAPPRPEEAIASINISITHAYVNTVSTLYGLLIASSAGSDSELSLYCAHAPDYTASLNAMMLNGTLVESTICNVKAPMSTNAAVSAIRTWMSRTFIIVVENASNVSGWLNWLCENLDAEAMEEVGLDGKAVYTRVCSNAVGAAAV